MSKSGMCSANTGNKAKPVLEALLEKYSNSGLRTPVEIIKLFGGKYGYLAAIRELENALYSEAA